MKREGGEGQLLSDIAIHNMRFSGGIVGLSYLQMELSLISVEVLMEKRVLGMLVCCLGDVGSDMMI